MTEKPVDSKLLYGIHGNLTIDIDSNKIVTKKEVLDIVIKLFEDLGLPGEVPKESWISQIKTWPNPYLNWINVKSKYKSQVKISLEKVYEIKFPNRIFTLRQAYHQGE
ncbi:hypothetical protein DKP78_16000, partial [Enterococcus faecium]